MLGSPLGAPDWGRGLKYALPVEEARTTLRVSLQVTHEAFQDGLFTAEELAATVGELRAEYVAALAALGVDAASLPDPTTDPPRPASRTDMFKAFPDRPASSSGASSSGRVRAEHEPLQSQQQPQQRWSGRASTPVQAEARPQSHRWGGDVSPPGSERQSRLAPGSSAPSSRAGSPRRAGLAAPAADVYIDSRQRQGRSHGGPSTPPGGATPLSLHSSGSSLDMQEAARTVPHATSQHLEALAAAESAGLVAPGSHALATAAASATARQLSDSEACRMGAETALVAALEQLENERAATSAAEARADALAEDVAMLRATLEAQNDALGAALEQVTHLKARLNAATLSGSIQQAPPPPAQQQLPQHDEAEVTASPQAAPEEWELPPTEAQKAALAHTPPLGGHSLGRRSRSGSPISPPGAGPSTTPGGMSRRHVLAAEVAKAEEEDARESEGCAGSASETDAPGSSPDTASGVTPPPGTRSRPPRGLPPGRKGGSGKSAGGGGIPRDGDVGGSPSPAPAAAVAQQGTPAAPAAAAPRALVVGAGEMPPGGGGGCFVGLFGRKRPRT